MMERAWPSRLTLHAGGRCTFEEFCDDATHRPQPPPVSWLFGRGQPGPLAGDTGRSRPGCCRGNPGAAGPDRHRQPRHGALARLLDLPAAQVVGVCDPEPKHRMRGQGIVEKVQGRRPEAVEDPRRLLDRPDVDAVIVAVPCDLHESIGSETLRAGKHLYAEKPLALTLAGCDRLSLEAARRPALAVHVGFQRRSNPRFREGVERIRGRELGPLIEARATWTSSNGPLSGHGGWLAGAIGRAISWSSRPCISGTFCTGCTATCRSRRPAGAGGASSPSKTPAAT